MTRRPTSRVMIAAALVASLVALVPGAASAAEPDASKLSPAMAALLEEGYGDFPIEEVVAGHREG
ncbi:MAG: hypothetical protein HY658_05285, partial [Actinobacteria bacterium]|nr:hypothetical protein [Actinomycetota bacterium]